MRRLRDSALNKLINKGRGSGMIKGMVDCIYYAFDIVIVLFLHCLKQEKDYLKKKNAFNSCDQRKNAALTVPTTQIC